MEKLLIQLKLLSKKKLDDYIGELVRHGLDAHSKALDVVRVIGNSAVHPGQIDLKDGKSTAIESFAIVSRIVDRMIAAPKQIDEMYVLLPPGALEAIEKRDKRTS